MLSTFRNLFVQYTYKHTHTRGEHMSVCACVIKLNTELPSALSQKHSLATFTAPVATSILSDEFLLCVLCLGLLFFALSTQRVLFYVCLQAKLFCFPFFFAVYPVEFVGHSSKEIIFISCKDCCDRCLN